MASFCGGRTALVVMARYPEPGKVKTRLASVIGAVRACELYRAFLRDLDARFATGRRELVWAYTPATADFAPIVRPGSRCVAQSGANLAERMLRCFAELGATGFEPIIMIGADVPHVREEWFDEAEAALAKCDVVLGPSEDGGYYLVAMRQPHDIFTGVEMGAPRVFQQTMERIAALRLRVELLPRSFDIDEAEDLQRLRAEIARDGRLLPFTAAILRDLELWS